MFDEQKKLESKIEPGELQHIEKKRISTAKKSFIYLFIGRWIVLLTFL